MIRARYRERMKMDPAERALDAAVAATRDLARIRRSDWARNAAHERQMTADREFVELAEPRRYAQWEATMEGRES